MKKAKIILEEDEIIVMILPEGEEEYCFNSSLTRKNKYIVNWIFKKIAELKYLGYSIDFENKDNSQLPEDAF